jgi:glutaredoxin
MLEKIKKKSKTSRRRKTKTLKKKSKSVRRKTKTLKKKSKSVRRKSPKEYTIQDKYFKGDLKIFSKDYCSYCIELKKILTEDLKLTFKEIEKEEADKYGVTCGILKDDEKFQTVPQLFSVIDDQIFYLGGYIETKNIIDDLKRYR